MELIDRCTLCYSPLDLRPGVDEDNWSQSDFEETLFKILDLKKTMEEFRTHPSLLFCSACINEIEEISQVYLQFDTIVLRLNEFRKKIEEDLVRSFSLQEEICQNNQERRSAESQTNSWALRGNLMDKMNEDFRRRARVEQLLHSVTITKSERHPNDNDVETEGMTLRDPLELDPPTPPWVSDDDPYEETLGLHYSTQRAVSIGSIIFEIEDVKDIIHSHSEFKPHFPEEIPIQVKDVIQTQLLFQPNLQEVFPIQPSNRPPELEVRLNRIELTYPSLLSSMTLDLSSVVVKQEPSTDEVDIDTDIDLSLPVMRPPSNLLDMNYYILPTKCLVPGCKRKSVFTRKEPLRDHIERIHIKATYDPYALLTYPAPCPEQYCTSTVQFPSQAALVEHLEIQHAYLSRTRGPGRKRKAIPVPEHPDFDEPSSFKARLNTYTKFPSKCKEPTCTSSTRFRTRRDIARHLRTVHSSAKRIKDPLLDACIFPTKCPVPNCPSVKRKTFTSKPQLRRHLLGVHNEKRMEMEARSRQPWDIPLANFPAQCPHAKCRKKDPPRTYGSKITLKRHYQECHIYAVTKGVKTAVAGQTEQCEQCGKVCIAGRLRSHMKVHDTQVLICEDCGSQFKSDSGLKEHRKIQHAAVTPSFPCTLCPKTFKMKVRLRIHMDRHNLVKKVFCPLCPRGFMFKSELRYHSQYVHAEELGLKKVECTVCGKHFTKDSVLEQHMVQHTGKADFKCEICGYGTSRRVDFREHMDTVHSEEFGYECEQCGKKFKLERRLRSHLLSHKDSYDHECEDCKKRFACKRTLKVHRWRKHGDEGSRPTEADEDNEEDDGEEAEPPVSEPMPSTLANLEFITPNLGDEQF